MAAHRTDVWGNAIGSETGSNHRFCGGLGHTTDSDTGLIYMRARYYDPTIGRFASEDPSKNGENWYVYCGDNPVGNVDADGKRFNAIGVLGALLTTLGSLMLSSAPAMAAASWIADTAGVLTVVGECAEAALAVVAAIALVIVVGALLCGYTPDPPVEQESPPSTPRGGLMTC